MRSGYPEKIEEMDLRCAVAARQRGGRMSITFYMPYKKQVFSNKEMKIGELMELIPNLEEFSLGEEVNAKELKGKSLSEYSCILLGEYERSARGFELSYEKNEKGENFYCVRVFTPSSIEDWKLALEFIKALSNRLNVSIRSEHGDVFTSETIENFPYRGDILWGIQSMLSVHDQKEGGEGEDKNTILFGILRPVALNQRYSREILNAKDPALAFSEFMTKLQYLEAYSARQRFYRAADEKEEAEIIGVYVLTEGVDTILPYKPEVEFQNTHFIDPKQVKSWRMNFVMIDGDPEDPNSYKNVAAMDYEAFIRRLPPEGYKFIDGAYILVEGLGKAAMQEIIEGIEADEGRED